MKDHDQYRDAQKNIKKSRGKRGAALKIGDTIYD
jgi:hypothetical protein